MESWQQRGVCNVSMATCNGGFSDISEAKRRRGEWKKGKAGEGRGEKNRYSTLLYWFNWFKRGKTCWPLNTVKPEEISVFSQTSLLPISLLPVSFLFIWSAKGNPIHLKSKGGTFLPEVQRGDPMHQNAKERNGKQRSLWKYWNFFRLHHV